MPRSENRRTIEVPVQLYNELKERAEREGTTIPVVLQMLITNGKSVEEWYGEMVGMLYEVLNRKPTAAHASRRHRSRRRHHLQQRQY